MLKRARREVRTHADIARQLIKRVVALIEGSSYGCLGKERRAQILIQIAAGTCECWPRLVVVGLTRAPQGGCFEFEHIIDAMLSQQGDLLGICVVTIETRLADIDVRVDELTRHIVRLQRPFNRNELGGGVAVSLLQQADDSELRIRCR